LNEKYSTTIPGHWFILAGAVLWGTTGTAQAFSPSGFNPLIVGTLRLVVGSFALLFLAYLRKELAGLSSLPKTPLVLAAGFTAGYQLFFFSGVAKTGVAIGTVVGIGSAPIVGGLLGFLFLGERIGKRWIVATLLAIFGCVLLGLTGKTVETDIIGILLAIGAGCCYASLTLVLKGTLKQHSTFGILAIIFCLATLFLSPLLLWIDTNWLLQPKAIGAVLHLGIAATAIPYLLFAQGLKTVKVGTATTLSLAEPMTAASLGILILGEQVNLSILTGIVLIFGGLIVLVAGSLPQHDRVSQ